MLQKNPLVASKGQPQLQVDCYMEQPHQKEKPAVPFNIVDSMKKLNMNMSVWDRLAIPGQRDMLQVALEGLKGESGSAIAVRGSVLTNHLQDSNNISGNEVVKDPKPPPFYLTVIVGNKLVHNCMVDSGASSSIMPKEIADKLGLKYQPLEKGVVQLDGTAVNTLGIIKGLDLTLHSSPNFVVPQDI